MVEGKGSTRVRPGCSAGCVEDSFAFVVGRLGDDQGRDRGPVGYVDTVLCNDSWCGCTACHHDLVGGMDGPVFGPNAPRLSILSQYP
ncbi:hypothetical protein D9M72_526240 [compost metagenome]